LYWDAVDYLQPGHDAVTRWGFLRGPERDFQRRPRWYGMRQLLPFLQPGARVAPDDKSGGEQLHALGVMTSDGIPSIVLVNQDWGALDVTIELNGAGPYTSWTLTRTERGRLGELMGRVRFDDATTTLRLPPRSITSLMPAGASVLVDEDAPD
jgi:hypothetical protein